MQEGKCPKKPLPEGQQKTPQILADSEGLNTINMDPKVGKKGIPLDTLAQLPTDDLKSLKKRARSKWYTTAISGRLLYLDSPLHKYYQSAFYCSHILKQEGKKVTAHYCNTRICHICNRIRTAKLMNGYVSQLQKLGSLQFVTLTVPNCSVTELDDTIDSLLKSFSNILRVIRERRKISINGIRKLEVTYNYVTNTYHPHIHVLVDGGSGEIIVTEWLKRYDTASEKAQDCRNADAKGLNEIFKYTTKIVTKSNKKIEIYIPALDSIMLALRGRRCFQPFGSIKKVEEDITGIESVEYDEIEAYDLIEWIWDECDWVADNRTLTGYISPDVEFEFIE